jgi:cytochrome c6
MLKKIMLKKQFLKLMTIVTVFVATLSFAMPAHASDVAEGAKVFAANCAACHAGGRNVVNPTKSLKKADLEKYDMFSDAAIISQLISGKGAMPAFANKIDAVQMENVAAYVLSQAENNWAK